MSNGKPNVTIFTDGGADPNPGPGGWGVVLIHDASGKTRELSGSDPDTTNNRMELTAAIRALSALKNPCVVRLVTDSEYVKRGITRSISKWIAKDFKGVKNADLWRELVRAASSHDMNWEWTRGHAGNRHNERADQLATEAIRSHYRETQPVKHEPDAAEIYLIVSAQKKLSVWAAQVSFRDDDYLLLEEVPGASANRLDIIAAAEALRSLPDGIAVRIYSMSDYLRNGASMWMKGWKKRGWTTKSGDPVANVDDWLRLDAELSARQVEWPSVKEDDSYELVFEDLGMRVQEELEYRYASPSDNHADYDSPDAFSYDV